MSELTLYHGSDHIVETPLYGKGKIHNDYGRGFYCTQSLDLAKEWSVGKDRDGYANIYSLRSDGLNILDLSDKEYSVLHWITILVTNRTFNTQGLYVKNAVTWLKDNFSLPTENYDIIKGYRADDSYFLLARDFLLNRITIKSLSRALKLGNLGEQIVLKSRESFAHINFVGCEVASSSQYYKKRCQRAHEASAKYQAEILSDPEIGGIRLSQLVEGEVKSDDPRLWDN